MNGVRAQLLELLVEAGDHAVSVNSLACSADVSHYIVRQHLDALVSLGTVVKIETDGAGVTRYRRKNEEDETMTEHDNRPLADRILEVLPRLLRDGRPGLTTLEIGSKIKARPNTVTAELKLMLRSGQVSREGEGKRGDPYRFYRTLQEDVTGPAYVCPDCGLDWPTGGPGVNHACEPAMRAAGIHPDQDLGVADEELDRAEELEIPAGAYSHVDVDGLTKRPPEDALPEGYTDAAEVLAAGIRAQEAEKAQKEAPGATEAADLEAPDTVGPPDPELEVEAAGVESEAELRRAIAREEAEQRYVDDPHGCRARAELAAAGPVELPEELAIALETGANPATPGEPELGDLLDQYAQRGDTLAHLEAEGTEEHADGVRLPRPTDDPEELAGVPLSQQLTDHDRRTVRAWSRAEALELEAEIQAHLDAGVPLEQLVLECHLDGSTVKDRGPSEAELIGPAIGFEVAAKNLRARAEEARRDLGILEAAAVLCERLRNEELDLASDQLRQEPRS
ncbi:hypothetical protein LCGC14_0567970 [marine sediment metagenome]|uniref:Uncharacterized protein n=1 Tax=marine sediment metagenome TaxID=412755 RepID=A0A0F9S3Q9_9ZZZZ